MLHHFALDTLHLHQLFIVHLVKLKFTFFKNFSHKEAKFECGSSLSSLSSRLICHFSSHPNIFIPNHLKAHHFKTLSNTLYMNKFA